MQTKFSAMVQELRKPGAAILEQMTAEKADLWHMAVGLVGEYLELEIGRWKGDKPNILEELGDCHFYAEGIAQNTGVEPYPVEPREHSMSDIVDLVKKHCCYGQELKTEELALALSEFTAYLLAVGAIYSLSLEDVMKANIEKLQEKRYKNGYSDQAAAERADKVAK